jgi:hypothetical protein
MARSLTTRGPFVPVASAWNDCASCGGRRSGDGPHGATWRVVGGLQRLVDCSGQVVDHQLVEGHHYEDQTESC